MRSEERKKYEKKYYAINKKEILKRQKKYNNIHKEEHKEYEKQWRIKNKEKIAERKKQDYINNKEQHQEYSKKYYNTNKESFKKRSRKYTIIRHGITEEQYKLRFDEQEGKCVICGKHQNELKSALHIDHNHETKKIRGLLCMKCNRGIGYFDDSIEKLTNAIKYLKIND